MIRLTVSDARKVLEECFTVRSGEAARGEKSANKILVRCISPLVFDAYQVVGFPNSLHEVTSRQVLQIDRHIGRTENIHVSWLIVGFMPGEILWNDSTLPRDRL